MCVNEKYIESLNGLEEILNEESAKKIDEILDNLYQTKPVLLKWFILKARTTKLLKKDTSEIYETLFKKYNLLYNDNELRDVAECLMKLNDKDVVENRRLAYHIAKKENLSEEVTAVIQEYDLLIEKYINEDLTQDEFLKLIDNCFVRNDYIQYVLFCVVYEKKFNTSININYWVSKTSNIETFIKRLRCKTPKNYIVLYSDEDSFNCNGVIKALNELNNNVFYIDAMLDVETQNKVNIIDTLAISAENIEKRSDRTIFRPVRLFCNGEVYGDNIEYIVYFINQNIADDNLTMLLSSGKFANKLCESSLLRKNIERLSTYRAEYFEDNLNLCWSGEYTSYMSEFYGFDVKKLLNQDTEYDFSIVIPVRNSIDTFKYTLKSCLELRYKGKYEILVSDNSTAGNTNVYDYIKSIDDSRINYYKPPFPLSLTKNFEYAFLNAKGNFIFSIGADDGVLPWALDILDMVLKQMPDNEIFHWDRGFYCWPGFNRGQQNQFVIPQNYSGDSINVDLKDSIELLGQILVNPQNMYIMPFLYINSGIRRSYLNTLLEKSGRLWDGPSQDIYMGVLNLSINKNIATIAYPLTVAGMSGHSLGMHSNFQPGVLTDIDPSAPYPNILTFSIYENLIPPIGIDIQNLYSAVLRVASRGILPKDLIMSMLNNLYVFDNQIALINKEYDMYDEYMKMYMYSISQISDSLLSEFKNKHNDLYSSVVIQKPAVENTEDQNYPRYYKVGFSPNGSLTLDASEFDVKNVYEAVKLFEKILGM